MTKLVTKEVPMNLLAVTLVEKAADASMLYCRGRRIAAKDKEPIDDDDAELLLQWQQMLIDSILALPDGKAPGKPDDRDMDVHSVGPSEVTTGVPSTADDIEDVGIYEELNESDADDLLLNEDDDGDFITTEGLAARVADRVAKPKAPKKDADEPPLPPPAGPPLAPDTAADFRFAWWLARSCKRATCKGCNESIDSNEFRLVYEPGADEVPDPRKWNVSFWKYYHIRSSCLRLAPPLAGREQLAVDVAPLAQRFKEPLEEYHASIELMKQAVMDAFAAVKDLPSTRSSTSASSGLVRT